MPTFQLGSKGSEVRRIQARLQSLGLYRGALDGYFGGGTQLAIRTFQQTERLAVDGAVGPLMKFWREHSFMNSSSSCRWCWQPPETNSLPLPAASSSRSARSSMNRGGGCSRPWGGRANSSISRPKQPGNCSGRPGSSVPTTASGRSGPWR